MRWLAPRRSDAEVDVRLAVIRRHELGMTIREMKEMNVAELRDRVEVVRSALRARRLQFEREARSGRGAKCAKEVSPVHARRPRSLIDRRRGIEQERRDVLNLLLG